MTSHASSNPLPVLPGYFPSTLFRLLQHEGINAGTLLAGCDFSQERFEDPDFRLDFFQHQRFLNNALQATGDPHLGVRLGNALNVTSLGILGYAALSSDTIETALDTISRYFAIRAPLLNITVGQTQGRAYLQIDETRTLESTRYFMLSAAISGAVKLVKSLAQVTHLEVKADIASPCPAGADSAFGFPVTQRQLHTRVYFPSTLLSAPLSQADPQTARSSIAICEQLLETQQPVSDLAQRLRRYLKEQGRDFPSMEEAARHLCVSSRTLRRSLHLGGSSFQQEIANIKHDIATAMLTNTGISIQQVALELGYSDLPNFGRAFRKWTGQSPSQYRLQNSTAEKKN